MTKGEIMTDSFFTTRNLADAQFDGTSHLIVMQFLDASARRLATLEGPLEAAKRLQRLADICSGAYVLPIEHWGKAEVPKAAEPEPRPSWFLKLKRYLTDNTVFAFWLGFLFGCFITFGRQ
ncbi:hypothetical protein [Mesorhizobium sp. M4A.F.Ca.ET.090.04.2.1]|uniref:hypothetical protein n=1 Tax=Mesorhizobium sp. M4A.F.Ca.ET.090.04.2.1 TaxID=2496663 RepID=UPI000FCCAEA2|nr:hypothetical protein [Mesorhizobium sp. M4A.F.Ca.ET.090.04.2.1]